MKKLTQCIFSEDVTSLHGEFFLKDPETLLSFKIKEKFSVKINKGGKCKEKCKIFWKLFLCIILDGILSRIYRPLEVRWKAGLPEFR